MFEIIRYTAAHETEWNAFVGRSKNGTFLIDRRYMDYHADRFTDHSLLFYRDDGLYALLPADISSDGTLHSHRGLTYGGLMMTTETTADDIVTLFKELNVWLYQHGIVRVVYKSIPWIYHAYPAEEDAYALFCICQARLTGRDIASVIPLDRPLKWARDRRYGANKATKNGITIACDSVLSADELPPADRLSPDDVRLYKSFWNVLEGNLGSKYGARPVHTVDEMLLLKSRFPGNIRLYVAVKDGEVVAGTVLYITRETAHAQYISASPDGKRLRAIDAIYDAILNGSLSGVRFFDFGKSTEEHGLVLNAPLIYQKEGFGGRGVCYDTYEWDVTMEQLF